MTLYSELGLSFGMGTGALYSAIPSLISGGNGINLPKKTLFKNSLPFIVFGMRRRATAILLMVAIASSFKPLGKIENAP